MSLQFIFGNSGAGKSRHLYEWVIRESMAHPSCNYLVLVPEQFTMQTQKDLCELHPRGGIMNIDVLSFIRLSHRVFEETGVETRRVLDDEGKNLILRKIAGTYEKDLRVLKGNLKKQGYISEVKSVISEFTQYGIGFEELDAFLETLEPESYLSYKLQDIRKVYEGFEEYLADKYITKEELLDVLSENVPNSRLLWGSVVTLDGFTGFTPVQNRLLGELLKVCERVVVTVDMDKREDAFTYRHPYQLFALSKELASSLVRIAGEQKVPVEEPVYLYDEPVWRFRDNAELAFLESEIFRYGQKKYEEKPHDISLHAVQNPREEAEFVAAKIRQLVREKGYRYRDVAVIAGDMEVYAAPMEKACEAFGIPVFIDHKKSILLNAFVEYVRSVLCMAAENFSYESVFRFLRTGMSGFMDDEVDLLENYCLALGLKGYKKWQGVWARKNKTTKEEELAALNGLRVRFVEKVDALVFILKKRQKTVKDVTTALYEFLVRENMQEKVQRLSERFLREGELALAKEYAQVYRIVIELFDKFVELLGDEKMSLEEYCELLDAGLEEAKVGVIPPSMDQVVVGDVERTRLNHLKVLFFMGANDVFLPGNLGQGGLLSERDREAFAEKKMALSPGAKEKAYVQKFYLYMNLTKPSDRLFLTFSKVSSDGKALRPAYLIQDIRRMYPLLNVNDEDGKTVGERELTPLKGAYALAGGLQNRVLGLDDQWKELYTWYWREESHMSTRHILDAAFYERNVDCLKDAKDLYGDLERVSVTRLERFASCAYAHFLTYGLRLSEREIYQFEAMDLGNIAHQSMERFSRKADERQVEWTEMPEELRARFIEESVEESILDYGNTVLYSTARNEYLVTRIKQLIYRSVWALTKQMEQGDFKPSGYEIKFGSGKIDRVDTCEDESRVYVKVTDYKTGMKSFDITAFYHGLQMQLPVYLNAALQLEERKLERQDGVRDDGRSVGQMKEVVPAGVFYYRMHDPIVERENDDAAVEQKILKELKLDGLMNADEGALAHLQRGVEGMSALLPFGRNKDGSLNKFSKVLSPEEFALFLEYTKKKERELKERMAAGEAAASPYELGGNTACDYCAYRAVCGFDARISGCEYRGLEKYTREEVMERIREEIDGS